LKVYDCVTFFNEVDLLYLRLSELDPVVDQFVVVQASTTFMGARRDLVWPESDPRLERFAGKIRHVVVNDLPIAKNPWVAEHFQRNAIARALHGIVSPDDVVLVSDVDEIPRRSAVERAKTVGPGQIGAFDMRFFYYGLNWRLPERWCRSRVFRADLLTYLTPEEVRSTFPDFVVDDSGWHFSYCFRRRELVDRILVKAGAPSTMCHPMPGTTWPR
jgi:beta-1,4-mannosyl-glycoprotein beta-1,4-N-acetylglucosaminyltransferase